MQHRAGDPKAKNGREVARGESTACHRPALGLTPCTVFEPQNSVPLQKPEMGWYFGGPREDPSSHTRTQRVSLECESRGFRRRAICVAGSSSGQHDGGPRGCLLMAVMRCLAVCLLCL